MSYIKLVDVTKKFGEVIAVNNLNFEIGEGECFSMLGPSGCGKTTTLRMIAGFEDIDDGEIYAGDKTLSSKKRGYYLPPEKRDFGMVFQAFAVWPHLSVYENVAFPLKLKKLKREEIVQRTNDALKHTNLLDAAKKSPADLSGGGKQRVALARALAINPKVMLLDEPLSSLDPHLREEMRFEIKDLQKHYGFAIVYVTHDQSEAMALSDRILVMKLGVVQQIDSPLKVYNEPANKFVFSFIGLSNFLNVSVSDKGIKTKDSGIVSYPKYPIDDALKTQKDIVLASRPSEIGFLSEGGIPGILKRKSFLGEIIDYAVDVNGAEIRIQKGRKEPGPNTGETCHLDFYHPHWYSCND
ncbi:MAG: ABC transporter ATP-binding protein [Elusimicrobiota bacterium]|jgi:iron(III) transport system ATP-binding protein|nr:ABC transporter ATP-binding protein [Elusimicrobiota bacterium]